MKSFFKKAKKFVGHDVWEKTEADFSSRKEWWFVRQARLILYTAQGVQHHNTVVRSAALTFFTLMSLVPMLALAFGIIVPLLISNAKTTKDTPDVHRVIRDQVIPKVKIIRRSRRRK